jgi:hypothetical protein
MGGPSSKAKYSLVTDSEQVPWGKGEKNPEKGSEIDLKSDAYNQSERTVGISQLNRDGVPFA